MKRLRPLALPRLKSGLRPLGLPKLPERHHQGLLDGNVPLDYFRFGRDTAIKVVKAPTPELKKAAFNHLLDPAQHDSTRDLFVASLGFVQGLRDLGFTLDLQDWLSYQ